MQNYRLLVVDDDERIVDLVTLAAKELGFVTHSVTGGDIERAYQQFQPHALVLDVLMPDKDGIEVLQYLKEQHARMHVVILSGSPDSYRRIVHSLGRAVGFVIHGNLSKPFRINEMRDVLRRIREALDDQHQQRPDQTAV